MTNNIEIMRKYMEDLGIPDTQQHRNDLYFDVQLIRRGKDNPDMPAANYNFKTYYIDSIELSFLSFIVPKSIFKYLSVLSGS